jgi:hypothetical protein
MCFLTTVSHASIKSLEPIREMFEVQRGYLFAARRESANTGGRHVKAYLLLGTGDSSLSTSNSGRVSLPDK